MDTFVPIVLSILALFGAIAVFAGVESRDGFDRDGGRDILDTRTH